MWGWGEFILAFAVFLLSHSIPVRPAMKRRLVARLGAPGFTLAYSALSIGVLAWLIAAAGRAPFVALWPWAPWQNLVTLVAMALACGIAALAIGRPNPFSFGGSDNAAFDPARPGIVGWTRHPLLVALLLWSLGHLLPNGDLAHVLLFGTFAGFSLLGMRLIDRRTRRNMGAADWARFAPAHRPLRISRAGVFRLCAGVGIFTLLLLAHGPVIGIQPVF
jgi:uncharacterized membrane protein